jgi:hypothetical protein
VASELGLGRVRLPEVRAESSKSKMEPVMPKYPAVNDPIADTLSADQADSWHLLVKHPLHVAGTEGIAVHTESAGPCLDPPSVFAVCVVAGM